MTQRRHASEASSDVTARSLVRPLMIDKCQSHRVGGVMLLSSGSREHFLSFAVSLAFDFSQAHPYVKRMIWYKTAVRYSSKNHA